MRAPRLLLEPDVREELGGKENKLIDRLGPGAVDCLLDLFLLEAGPGLRGKLSHGDMVRAPHSSSFVF